MNEIYKPTDSRQNIKPQETKDKEQLLRSARGKKGTIHARKRK